MYSNSQTRCPDDDIRDGVAVDVGNVQGVSEAGGDAAALTILGSRHLEGQISILLHTPT